MIQLLNIKSCDFIGYNLELKSKPITEIRRNELVNVAGFGNWRGWLLRVLEVADISRASNLIGSPLKKLMGSLGC